MSKKKVAVGVSLVLISVILFFSNVAGIHLYPQPKADEKLIAPIMESKSFSTNVWFPQQSSDTHFLDAPQITAKSAFFIDIDSGQVLFQKNIHERRPIASLVKIMTAIVALEHKNWGDMLKVSDYAASMEPDHMQLRSGEKLSVEELMYGLFLVSGNDVAEVFAEETVGSREKFMQLMNEKAGMIGMNNTYFINPSGLMEDGKFQYSTAYDVALMARYAIKNYPKLIDITSTDYKYISETDTHSAYTLYSGINLLTTYPGVKGFKTGYTPEAGLTLVTYAEKGGYKVLGVLLDSQSRREEARMLLDYSFNRLKVQ